MTSNTTSERYIQFMAVSDGLDTDHVLVSFLLLFQMFEKTTQRRDVYRGSLFQKLLPVADWLHRCRCVMMLNIVAAGESRGTKLLTSWESERTRGSNKIFPSKICPQWLTSSKQTSSLPACPAWATQCNSPLMTLVPQYANTSQQFLELTVDASHSLGEKIICELQ